jgi:ubiquinone/menaquinone biosynthesis C-methylase UbiE
MAKNIKQAVKKYYGEEIQETADLKSNVCVPLDSIPDYIGSVISLVNDEIKRKYYGCGSPIPLCIEGLKVLDVGCGTGRDCYIMSKLVGEEGFVYGIDMTENQIEVADKYRGEQTAKFGYKKPNVKFILDYMENIENNFSEHSLDLVTSNCVLNLAEDKEPILKQIFKILNFGGEFYFSDVYADRRVPEKIRTNQVLYGECLGGALYDKDFERIAKKAGFSDPRIVSKRLISITNEEVRKLVENINFYSITYRLWKIKKLEDAYEDYGHIATYSGGIAEAPCKFELDGSQVFYRNKPEKVCGNTACMLGQTRFKKYFKIMGDFKEHFGEFKDSSNVNTSGDDGTTVLNTGSCC